MKPSAKRFLSILMALALLFTTCLGILAEEAAIAPVCSAADGSEARGEAPVPEPADGDDAPAAVPGEAPIPEPEDRDDVPTAAPGETPVPEPADGDDAPAAAPGETPVPEPEDGDDVPTAAPGETPVPEQDALQPTEAPAEQGQFAPFTIRHVEVEIDGETLRVLLVSDEAGYDRIYIGDRNAENKEPFYAREDGGDGTCLFRFPLPLSAMGETISFVPGCAGGAWYTEEVLTLDVPVVSAAQVTMKAAEEESAGIDYSTDVDSSSSMFKVVSCTLNIRGGKIAATIALSGTGYDKLFVGTAAEAAAASEHIGYHLNGDGLYAFTLPVAALDTPIQVAAYAVKSAKWVERSLTFKSGDMEAVDGGEATDPDDGDDDDEDGETVKPPEKDSSGSTSRVDNTTSLPDGTYKPEKFSFSGGTGRVRITCPAVTVRNGRSYATIVFSSPNYSYVKASGSKYYGSHGGGVSTFEIPVRLNASNTIIGMTTTMSSDHEIAYSIYIYIAGADGKKGEAQDEDAPAVVGLRYESADALESAERFNIYRYADGYVVLSVRDGADYLLVPEGAEVPAGLDEGMAVIQLPVANAYVASGNVLELMGMIGVIDPIALLGCETELPQVADALARGAIKQAGAYTEPDYGALLASGCTLAILPAEITDEAYAVLSERLGMLGIPAFVDRSAQESTEEGRLEWLKLYGVLFGCEDTVEAYFASLGAA